MTAHDQPGSVGFSLELVTDEQAFGRLRQPAFVEAWRELARREEKFAAVQDVPFVATWYSTYREDWMPVLCVGRSASGAVLGIMPLARHRATGEVAHAGLGQAEYHGWVCDRSIEDAFPAACVAAVGRHFQLRVWRWRWLPPGASTRWIAAASLRRAGVYARVVRRANHVIDLHDEDHLRRIANRGSLKNNINRLKRGTRYGLDRVTDKAETTALMPTVAQQYDMRAGGMYGSRGFRGDPKKRAFFVERQNHPEAQHFAVLRSGDRVVAFNFGACDTRRVLLGLFAFDPLLARTSPGRILIVELAKRLRSEGFRYLDLTPGRQPFKDELANVREELVLPTFYFSRRGKIAADVGAMATAASRAVLARLGTDTPEKRQHLVHAASAFMQGLRRRGAAGLVRQLRRLMYSRVDDVYYRLDCATANGLDEDLGDDIAVQRYADLLADGATGRGRSERQFLATCLRRLTAGRTLYSITRNGVLAHSVWVKQLDATSVLLYDAHTAPPFRRQGLFTRTLRRAIRDCRDAGIAHAFVRVARANHASRRVIARLGFTACGGVRRVRHFAWVRRASFGTTWAM